jgi:hypothetical protein
MNERIKELSMKYAHKMHNSVLYNAEFLEEFAELIIKEAAKVASEKQNAYNSDLEFDILNYFEVE